MSTFHFFSRAHTDTHNDSDMGSLPLHRPWEIHHQPTQNISPPSYWQFDQPQQQQPTTDNLLLNDYNNSQFGVVEDEYHHGRGQFRWILPVKGSELEPTEEEYSGPTNSCTRKSLHNARERHRRKILKKLYYGLRSLLPNQNPKKKLSIPDTICRAVKYIPELRNEIRKLSKERAKLLAATKRSTSTNSLASSKVKTNIVAEGSIDFMHSPPPVASSSPDPIVSVNAVLSSSEMIITIYNCKVGFFFSTLLVLLENEGLDVVNASTFICQDRLCYSLHVEVIAGRSKVDTMFLQKKIITLL